MINIYPKALKKILIHSLIFGGKRVHSGEYKMVYGILGGNNIENQVHVRDACLLRHGEKDSVKPLENDYTRIALFNDELYSQNCFCIGWYCSLPIGSGFFSSTNYKNHTSFQFVNKLAIAIPTWPENYKDKPIQEFFKIYRLKGDLSENWIELEYEIIDAEAPSVINEIENMYLKLIEIFNIEDLDDKYLDDYLSKEYDL